MSSGTRKEEGSDKDARPIQYAYGISKYELTQLTQLLWMEQHIDVGKPDKTWLHDQQARIPRLDEALRRPGSFLGRISAYIDNYRKPNQTAHLCPAHQALDPKLIRRLFLLLVAECSERTDRFRVWRRRVDLPENITTWLDHLDNVSRMWIGRKAFRAVFGYDRASSPKSLVRQDCEACIMSAIGGRPQALSDLRASLVARSGKYPRSKRSEPRLLPLVESWIGQFNDDCSNGLRDASEGLATEIRALRDDLKRQKEERDKLRKRGSKASRSSRRGRSERKSERGKESRASHTQHPSVYRSSQENNRTNHGGGGYLDRRTGDAEPTREHEEPPLPGVDDNESIKEEEQTRQNEREGYATSNWMDGQMQSQGLPPEGRRQMFADDMHPAFSEYVAPSAVPTALFIRRSMPPQRPADRPEPESVWVPVSVYSQETGSNSSNMRPLRDSPPPLPRNNGPASLPPLEGEQDPYFEFCERWGFDPNPEFQACQSQDPSSGNRQAPEQGSLSQSSSVYSAHPGFRRSQGGGWEGEEQGIALRNPFDLDNNRNPATSTGSCTSTRSTRSSQISPGGTRRGYPAISKNGAILENPDETKGER
ncbi:hypothetical protein ACJ41O_003946 [Fusarium nematophilum]